MNINLKMLWSVSEAGSALGISPWTIRRFLRDGKLRSVRVGRRVLLEPDECRRFLEVCKATRRRKSSAGPSLRSVDISPVR
jgi:excisionase family DNA binding protein